jgi:WD40 repeat protein
MMRKFLSLLSLALLSVPSPALMQEARPGDMTYILDIAWSPDGERLAVAGTHTGTSTATNPDWDSVNGFISVIDGSTGNAIFVTEPQSAFTSVAWSPDGQRLALGSYDGTVWIVNALTGERITNLFGHEATVTGVDWSSDGSQIVSSGNWDKLTIVWDAQRYEELSRITSNFHPFAVSFSPDDQTVAIGLENGLYVIPVNVQATTATIDQYSVIGTSWVLSLAYSNDGRYIAAGTVAHVSMLTGERDNSHIYVIDAMSSEILHEFTSTLGSVGGLAWSSDDEYLAVLNEDPLVTLWDVEAETIVATYPAFGVERYDNGGIAFSRYGGRLAFGDVLVSESVSAQTLTTGDLITTIGDGAARTIVPFPSIEQLEQTAAACDATAVLESVLPASNAVDELSTFADQIENLPEVNIPPACAADLIAIAKALQVEE